MRIAFIDPTEGFDYGVGTPRVKPLGGSQSALCYLAEELGKRGHAVALYNLTKTPGESCGVKCFNMTQTPVSEYSQYDVVVILNLGDPEVARLIRSAVETRTRILLWTQHNPNQPAVRGMADVGAHSAWDGFIMVSRWQAEYYKQAFGVHPARIKIIGNAVSPVFENLFTTLDAITAQKPWPPVMCYTSAPYRGLDVLIEAFPRIRAAIPGATLKVYSSMGAYGFAENQDDYAPLYARCRATEGVEYIGSVAQSVLADELKKATCLAYPSIFRETSCISVMEAMVAGCIIITSDLGVLRETTAGFAHLLAPPSDRARHAELYADFAVGVLDRFRSSPAEHAEWLKKQVHFVQQTATWAVRAREWEEWLSTIVVRGESQPAARIDVLVAALQHHQAGRLQEAEALYRQVLQAQPNHPSALHWLGLIAHQVGRHDVAIDYISRAIVQNSGEADFHNNLGEAHRALGQFEAAMACYRQALVLRSDFAEAHNNMGNVLRDQGKFDNAIACYRRAVALRPDFAEAHNNLGVTFRDRGRLEEAIACYRQALTIRPGFPMALNLLGVALQDQGQLEEAVAVYRQALTTHPDFPEALNHMGVALQHLGKLQESAACYHKALALRQDFAEAHNNLGHLLSEQGRLGDAVACYERAMKFNPELPEAYINLGNAFKDQGQPEEAVRWYRRALEIKPDCALAHSNLVFVMCYSPTHSSKSIAAEHRTWNKTHAQPFSANVRAHNNDRNPQRKLRIGYVSGDFLRHPIGLWIEPLLAAHNRTDLEIVGYSTVVRSDGVTERLRALTYAWRVIAGLDDDAAARLIKDDRIDILVDLSGHSKSNRLLVFARKPAPVQVTYLGSLTTTGLASMDYKLSDCYLTPPGSSEWFAEQVVRLPGCFICYKAPAEAPPVAPLPAVANGHVTFGSFNNLAKVTPYVVAWWAKILHAVPDARLLLKDRTLADPGQQDRYQKLFQQQGISIERLDLRPATPFPVHLGEYGHVDIALDPFPYGGCYTSCEALWMGVPVVTLSGGLSCGRYGVSLLSNLGLKGLIASTPKGYVVKAVALAKQRKRLASLRMELRQRMAASPLCDADALAAGIEKAYRRMWKQWCKG
ncbi:MAG: tetratricopeptide repeat protein [Nitrospirae bacterium]|nr:MAG: tetratricopeptide repeat protein [Nitrospirota bacterium]